MADVLIVCESDMAAADLRRRVPEGVRAISIWGPFLGYRFDLIVVQRFGFHYSALEQEAIDKIITDYLPTKLRLGGMLLLP